jgi:hypothetical protein
MRLAATLIMLAAPAFAGTLPSGLEDPFASADACAAYAARIEAADIDPTLASIAILEGRTAHDLHDEDAKLASDVVFAWSKGADIKPAVVSVYVNRVCRSL